VCAGCRAFDVLTTWVIKPGRGSDKAGLCPVNEPILVCDIVPRIIAGRVSGARQGHQGRQACRKRQAGKMMCLNGCAYV
jgi:hypothetical protein